MIRNTDIKYLSVLDKIYRVTGIQWQQFTLEAEATNLSGGDVPPEEVSDILCFGDFTVRLINRNCAVNT
ncbi:MAG: hypothetical protein HFH49_13005 [Lachnospiraceae bacterium]|nr:hypothetical protein [Lachnospiraceae bacterium]